MHRSALHRLRCPDCRERLRLETADGDEVADGQLLCPCGKSFAIRDGIPDLVHPPGQPYDREDAGGYDGLIAWVARLLRGDLAATRAQAVALLELEPGARVLEVACGPGPNFPYLRERIGDRGELYALDIDPEMLRGARQKLRRRQRAELVLANGVYLPFADRCFDALLHVGTLNRFADVRRALAEMARVVRVGGKVVAADEGVAPWLLDREYGRILQKFGALFRGHPPLAALPVSAREVRLQWLLGQVYFAIDFRVGSSEPELNLDLPLPGRKETVREVLERKREVGRGSSPPGASGSPRAGAGEPVERA